MKHVKIYANLNAWIILVKWFAYNIREKYLRCLQWYDIKENIKAEKYDQWKKKIIEGNTSVILHPIQHLTWTALSISVKVISKEGETREIVCENESPLKRPKYLPWKN